MRTANDSKAFGARFRQAMLRKGHGRLGATELAEALASEFPEGLSIQSAHKWIKGTAVPRPERLAVLARWLDVSEHWLRFGPDPKNSNCLTGGANAASSVEELAVRLQALSRVQLEIVEALLLEFEKIPRD